MIVTGTMNIAGSKSEVDSATLDAVNDGWAVQSSIPPCEDGSYQVSLTYNGDHLPHCDDN